MLPVHGVRGKPKLTAEPVSSVRVGLSGDVEPAPQHSMLGSEHGKVGKRVPLVAVGARASGKASCDFASPTLFALTLARSICERFELRRRPAHVSRAAEHERIGFVASAQQVVIDEAAGDDAVWHDLQENSVGTGFPYSRGYCFREHCRHTCR
jgi:hypothetical protein